MTTDFKNKKIAILGLGIEGVSSAVFLHKKGTEVTVLDEKNEDAVDEEKVQTIRKLGIHTIFGKDALKNLFVYEMLVRAPGIKRFTKRFDQAVAKGVTVTSQTQLFFDMCPCPIIGVTGTKGKGTTATLIYEMLKKSGKTAYLGGNIGRPPFEFLDKLTTQSIVVLELSSFQLQDLTKSPHIAVMLMITQDHIEYHKDITKYVDAKRNIVRFQTASDAAILNRDYPATLESDIHTSGKIFYVSLEREVGQGCFVKDGKVILRIPDADVKEPHPTPRSRLTGEGTLREQIIIATKDIMLPGRHNWENVCAAVMAATLAGASREAIVSVLKTFKGLEHRLELVAEVHGVKYYDDSIATNPESAIAGIQAFSAPKILILGGVTEGSDFSELGEVISADPTIKAIVGIGKEWPEIKKGIKKAVTFLEGAKNMHEIVALAAKVATAGDIVLLSPACKSFDMFKSYKDRGEQFKKEVLCLKKDQY